MGSEMCIRDREQSVCVWQYVPDALAVAFITVLLPEQSVSFVAVNELIVAPGELLMDTVAVLVHPMLSVAVTVYTVETEGVAETEADVVEDNPVAGAQA